MIPAETIEWRKIPYIPDRFEVSNTGIVRCLPREVLVTRKDGRVLKRPIQGRYVEAYTRNDGKSSGHPVVSISSSQDEAKVGTIRVALLVARAFHGCPYVPGDLSEVQRWRVRHKDGDITNNHANNVEWVGNRGSIPPTGRSLYERNLARLEELRHEPVEDWIKRIWGEDYAGEVA